MRSSSGHGETSLSCAGYSWEWVPLLAPSESLALRPACCRDKEHTQELLSLPALVPQTVYRYRGDKALLCWLQRARLLKSLSVNGGKVINGGLHSIGRFVCACFFFNPYMETQNIWNENLDTSQRSFSRGKRWHRNKRVYDQEILKSRD